MNKEQKRKLRLIAVLSLALLVGGTFAFQAFNQQAINDRLRDNEAPVGGRVHDYYNRDTENKDVFVENYGQEEIMARIRLSEFMEIQHRGQTSFEPVVDESSRDDVSTWTIWKPNADNMNQRQTGTDSADFQAYSTLTFGWERGEAFAPWYLPTFNLDENDDRTAAAGHARDWEEGGGATDGITDGATHPGDGTDGYWSEDDSYNNAAGNWFGSQVTRETAQNLQQERPPMTMEQWAELENNEKIGDFWVIDYQTGWAYWASKLQAGETTSYLLDAAQMTQEANAINGSYYYGIHVSSHLVSPEHSDDFLNDENEESAHHEHLADFLQGIRNNAMDEDWGKPGLPTENPPADVCSPISDFNFGLMNPGRLFTTVDCQRFRYLEDMGDGNHLIIRDEAIRQVHFNEQNNKLAEWYSDLIEVEPRLEDIVQPVVIPAVVPRVGDGSITWEGGTRWLPSNLVNFPEVAQDLTTVAESGGHKQSFALSLADVSRLSQDGGAFSNHAERLGGNNTFWLLRTPGSIESLVWGVNSYMAPGQLFGNINVNTAGNSANGGVRPALIIHQSGT